jgi:O-antigen ligase
MWIVCQYAYEDKNLLDILCAYVSGSLVCSILVINAWNQGAYFRDALDRVSASGQDPNDQALMIALGLPLAAFVQRIKKNALTQSLLFVVLAVSSIAIVLTGSRGGFIAFLVSTSFYVFNWREYSKREKLVYLSLITFGAMLAYSLLPDYLFSRILEIPDQIAAADLTHRVDYWIASLDVFNANTFFGVGAGGIREGLMGVIGISPVAHNTYLTLLAELGIFGVSIMLFILIYIFMKIRNLHTLEKNLWLSLFCVLIIGTVALSWEYKKPFWFFIGLVSVRVSKLNHEVNRLT